MRVRFSARYGLLVACLALFLCSGCALAAPSQKELDAMGLFLSNFTELGFMDVDVEKMSQPDGYPDLVRFGVWHNYINNFKSRIEKNNNKPQDRGDLRIKVTYVEESVQKYFGIKIKADRSVEQSDPPYILSDGYFSFWGADGEAPWYARVKKASSSQKGLWDLSGEIYNADDPEDVYGTFNARVKEAKWGKKRTYVMVHMISQCSPSN
jgi:hypothetical protein